VSQARDDVSRAYDAVASEYAARFARELDGKPLDRGLLSALADLTRGRGRVLDVGCGPGHVAAHLHGLGVDAGGLDLSPRQVELARVAYPGVGYQVGDMLDLGVRGLAGIVALYAICHLPADDLPRVAASFAGALAPGGHLLVSFHVGADQVHLDDWWGHPVSLDFWFHTTDAVVAALEGAGLTIEARVERRPYPDVEHPSQRGYLLARRP
jgi:SAM-dependent methyltransferase